MNHPRIYRRFAVAAIGLLLAGILPGSVLAVGSTWYVNTGTVGGGSCGSPNSNTIDGAVALAGSGDTIHICAGTYNLSATISIAGKNLTFEGAGAATTVVNGGGSGDMFVTDSDISVTGMELANAPGRAISETGSGAVTATAMAFTANGGGISAAASGLVTVSASTFANNNSASSNGGAINAASLTVSNSTFWHNQTSGDGGAIASSGAPVIVNSTFSDNSATVNGDAISANGANISNSILAGSGSNNCHTTGSALTDGLGNKSTDSTCGFVGDGTLLTDLALGSLTGNGGPTPTIALGAGSVAINHGVDATCVASPVSDLDQRGLPRPVGTHCDSGAFESGLATLTISPHGATISADVGSQAYTAEGFDSFSNDLGDVTGSTSFTIDGSACSGAVCSATVVGDHTVVGTYAVTHTDTTTLHVTVGALNHILISPHGATITADTGSQTYTAASYDSHANLIGDVTGSTSFTIDGSACSGAVCSATVVGDHTVVGTYAVTHTDTTTLHVTVGALNHILISPHGATITADTGSQTYTAASYDSHANLIGDVTGSTSFTIDGSACSGAVCSATVVGDHTVVGTYAVTHTDTTTLHVTVGALNHILISPHGATITADTGSQTYTAASYDSHANLIGDVTGSTSFTIDGSACSGAVCSATVVGDHTVVGTYAVTHTDTTTLHVTVGALNHILISPHGATITADTGSQTYTAASYDSHANLIGDVTGSTSFTIDGSACSGAVCSATVVGDHTVVGTYAVTHTDTTTLHVTVGALNHILISPHGATITADTGSQTYTAASYDSHANLIGDVTGSTSFTIDGSACSGAVCSATVVGDHTVVGTYAVTHTDTTTLHVTVGALNHILISPHGATITADTGSQTYTAASYDSHANLIGDVTGSTSFTIDGSACSGAVCSATVVGDHTVVGTYAVTHTDTTTLHVTAGTPTKLVFTTSPVTLTAGNTSGVLTVQVQDAEGNPVAGVRTINLASGSAGHVFRDATDSTTITSVTLTSGQSTASFRYRDTVAGSPTITASSGVLADGTQVETISHDDAAKLVFTTSPGASTSGANLSPQPVVQIQDTFGNLITDDTSQVTLSIKTGTGTSGAHLTCTLNPKTASGGIATFAGCQIDLAGTGYQLHAVDGSLTVADSTTFTINPGTATRLVITGSSTQIAGSTQNLTITAKDASGNTDPTYTGTKSLTFSGANSSTSPVTAPTVTSSTGVATAFGSPTSITFSAGVATVSGANNGVMTLYLAESATIAAFDGSISASGADRLAVAVSHASLSKFALVLATPQTNAVAFSSTNTLTAQDPYGNIVTNFDASADHVAIVANSPLTGTVSGLGSGATNVLDQAGNFSSGVANLTTLGLKYTGNATSGTFTATSVSAHTGTSGAVTINPGTATRLVITGSSSQTAGQSQNLTITAKDASGNTDPTYTGTKSLTFSGANSSTSPVTAPTVTSSTGVATAFGSPTSITFSAGVATVSGANNGVMTLYLAESATIAAFDGSISASGADRLAVAVSHASLSKFALVLATPQTNAVAFSSTNTLTAQDPYGNIVTNFDASADHVAIVANSPLTGTVSGLGSGATNVLDQAGNFSSGVANLTTLGLKYTGNATSGTFTATSVSAHTGTSGAVTINPGTATRLVITGSSTQIAGSTQNLTITAKDASGNTDPTYTGTKSLTFSGANSSTSPVTAPTVTSSTGVATAFGSPTSITFSAGVATVSGANNGVMTLYLAESATIAAFDGSISASGADRLAVAVSHASLSKFALVLATPQTNAVAFSSTNTLTAQDPYGNIVTNFDASADHVAIVANSPLTGTVSGLGSGATNVLDQAGNFSSGVANLTTLGLKYTGNATSGTFTATSVSAHTGTSGAVTINPGTATRLVITGSSTQIAGSTQNLTITAKDASGNTDPTYTGTKSLTFSGAGSSTSPVTAPTVTSSTGVATAFGSPTSITFSAGVATVSGANNGVMTLYLVESATIAATDGSISASGTDRLAVAVSHAAAAKLALVLATPQINAVAFGGTNTLTAQDPYGNTVTNFDASADHVAIVANSPLTGTVSGLGSGATNVLDQAGNFSSGVANLTTLGLKYTGNATSGTFTATSVSAHTGTSGAVTINPGTATRLVITGSSSQTAGQSQNLTITAKDASGNTDPTYTGTKSLTFSGAGSSTSPVTAPTVTSSTGVATAFGSPTSITFSAGVATVSGANNGVMTLYLVESATIAATDGSISASGTDRLAVAVSHAAAAKLAFTATPSTSSSGIAFGAQPVVEIWDAFGNLVSNDVSDVTLSIKSGTGTTGAVLTCTTNPKTAVGGTATFAGCKIDLAGNGYELHAVDSALTAADSVPFNVAAGTATRLVITGSGIQTAGVSQNLTIRALDDHNNIDLTYAGDKGLTFSGANSIGIFDPTVASSTGSLEAFGTSTTITFIAGVANVSGATNGAMVLYKVETAIVSVTDGTLSSVGADRLTVTVSHATVAKLILAGPGTATAGTPGSYTVTAFDAYGNTATGYAGSVTITSSDAAMTSAPPSGGLTQGVGTFQVTLRTVGSQNVGATDGSLVATAIAVTVKPVSSTYYPLTPVRLLDSRVSNGLGGAFGSHAARTFQVTGRGNVPAGAIAVTGNLTVTGQSSGGYLYVGPVAMNDPTSSTLNFPLGDDRANGVTVALGAGGTLSVTFVASAGAASAHVIFDVTGYFMPNTNGATYMALSPARLLDTRSGNGLGGPSASHGARTFQVTGRGGVPASAIAVTGNLTVTGQSSNGYLYIGPVAANNPTSSTLNFPRGDDRANGVTVALGTGGTLSVTFVAPTLGPTAHVIFDVTGFFLPGMSGATYVPLSPSRLLDTRSGNGLAGPFTSHGARSFGVANRGGVPANAIAVTGNLTVTGQTSPGYLFVGPVAMNDPTSSTLNFPVGDDRANGVTVALGGGSLGVTFVAPGPGPVTHVIFDVTGYFTP